MSEKLPEHKVTEGSGEDLCNKFIAEKVTTRKKQKLRVKLLSIPGYVHLNVVMIRVQK